MNEEEETKIAHAEEEEGDKEDDGEKAVTEDIGRVAISPIVLGEDLPPPTMQVYVISKYYEVHVDCITLCMKSY
jgi:hypothetical protein